MKIAIGTKREPKIAGIRAGVATCPYFTGQADSIEYLPVDVASGISHMPLTVEEMMTGARNRADNILKEGIMADFYIGMEGGVARIGEKSYSFGCIYVRNPAGEGHFGFSPMIEVPGVVEKMLFEDGRELGPAMDELSGKTDVKSKNGSNALWTDDMITREEEFTLAFHAAIAPFFNRFYKIKA